MKHTKKLFIPFPFLLLSASLAMGQVTFQTVPIVSIPNSAEELAKGDFNNDGKIDLVSCNFTSLLNQQVTILLNSGSGTFSGSNKRNFASATNALDVAVGDFNEDGNLDVVTCSQSNDNFSLLLGDGAGNLAAPLNFTAGDTPQGIAVGDMNKDNHLDVLVSNRGTPEDVYLFFGNGSGGFSVPTVIPITNVSDIAVADFNGDTHPDFAVVIANTVQPFFNDGTGLAYIPGTAISGFNSGQDIIAENLDNDTDIDIIAGSAYTLNDGTGAFGTRIILAQSGNEYTVGDLNKDGNPDIVANDNSQNTPNVRVLLGDGLGGFNLLAKFETNAFFTGVEVVDTNNDSNLDIVGIGSWGGVPFADVLLGDGTGYVSNSIIKYPTPTDPRDIVKGDFNEDGVIDVALCHSVGSIVTIYLGQGNGKFQKTVTNYTTGSFPIQLITLDYNKDSHLDLATYNQSGSSVTVLTGAGNGSFTVLGNIPVTSTITGRMTTADFNNDTNPDLVVSGYTSRVINFISGTGSGFNSSVTTAVSGDVIEIKAGDFNGDGNQDLIADLSNINRFILITGNGAGTFSETATQYLHGGSFFLIEDLNNDSKPDVIAFSNGGADDFFINDGAGNFTGSGIAVSLGGFPWGYADMNGDGFKDLIVGAQNSSSSSPGQIVIFKGDASGITNSVHIDKDYSGGNRLVLHDVNTDGKPDIIATSFNLYEDYFGTLINTSGASCTPPVVTSAGPTATLCEGLQVTFSVSATGTAPLSYEWRKLATPIAGQTSSTFNIPSISLADAGQYAVNVTNACGSYLSPAFSLFVNTVPTAPTATNASSCAPASVTLNAAGGANTLYRWYTTPTGGSPIAGEVNNTYTTPVLSSTTTYYVSIKTSCESSRTPVTVTIGGVACSNQPPVLSTTTSNSIADGTATIDLNLLVSDPDNNIDINSFSVVTAPSSGASVQIVGGVLTIDYAGTNFTGSDQLTVQVCDLLGSCTQQQITINVSDSNAGELIIFNGISPNKDSFNEKWVIQNIDILPDTRENKVSIFNRWGDLVFEVSNYDNNTKVFTGINKNGNELPSGVYFYKIEFSSGRQIETGYLSLKK